MDTRALLHAEDVGSDDYYIRLTQLCKKGCQTCFECPLVLCHDNNHALRIQALEHAVLDFTYAVAELKRKLARKDELLESTTAVVHRHQADAKEHRERLEHLRGAIEVNQNDANEKGEHWDELDASDQQDLGELEHYIAGLQAALQIMDTEGKDG